NDDQQQRSFHVRARADRTRGPCLPGAGRVGRSCGVSRRGPLPALLADRGRSTPRLPGRRAGRSLGGRRLRGVVPGRRPSPDARPIDPRRGPRCGAQRVPLLGEAGPPMTWDPTRCLRAAFLPSLALWALIVILVVTL